MRKLFKRFVILFLLIGILNTFSFISAEDTRKLYKNIEIFTQALHILKKSYVKDVSSEELIYGALKGMLSSLDSYSRFLTPEEYKELKVETKGEFGGLGIEISIKDGLLTIITPIEGTPAWKAGLKPGDIIVKINDELTKNITLDEAVKKLRGKPGTKVKITILREKENMVKDFVITRDVIKIKDIKIAKILEDKIAYVKLTEFREHTPEQLDKILKELKSKGMQALILDLRNNPGGLLDSAIEVASRFVPYNTLVVYIQERDPKKKIKYYSKYKKSLLDIPMVVLINKGSASGSEIVAACLQDTSRAVIMGRTSFGKGSVQTVLSLPDNSAIRFTTAYYYSPKGKKIQDVGVIPDIKIEDKIPSFKETKSEEVFERIEEKKEEKLLKDYFILRAVDLLKAILIYKQK